MQALVNSQSRGKPNLTYEGFDTLRFNSRLRGRARHSCWTRRFHGWRNIPARGAARDAHSAVQAEGGKPCESQRALSQGLLGRFTSLILIIVYSSMAASRAAGRPPHPVPPSHPPGDRSCSQPSLVPVHPHPQAPTQRLCPPPPSGTWPHPSLTFGTQELPTPPPASHLCTLRVGLLLERQKNIYPHFAHGGSLVVGSTA